MSKSTLFGLAAAAVLIGACNGEIGGLSSDLAPGSPRDGDLTATLSVSNGSRTVEATERAYDTLEFEFMARPGGAQVDAGIAVAADQSVDMSEAPIRVRFGEDGFIDVQDGGQWTKSTMMPYEAYVWYRIRISADVASETYAVEVEPKYDVKQGAQEQRLRTLVEGAAFDRRVQKQKWLAVWSAWSSNDYTLDIAKPSWFVSGRCAPATCQSLGSECGVTGDGCGGTLSCGVCDAAEACRGGICVDLCAPETCASLGVECGTVDDGCGGTLTCGACANGEACTEGLCVADACVPDTCLSLGAQCGAVSDGCGGTLSCGGCASGSACTGGICEPVCTPATCASWGVECGTLDDGCGGTLNCGGCPSGELCSYGSCVSASQPPPSCLPDTCQSLGVACGAASDGCGGTLSCGGCRTDQACLDGVCENVCTPRTCASLGVACGTVSDGCGGTVSCGGCGNGQACTAGVCENVCTPQTCVSLGVECGAASNGCGGTLSCGGCALGQVCDAGACVAASPPSCNPYTCSEIGASCGAQSDGCGGVLSCGSCASGSTCSSGRCVAAGSKTFFATRTTCMAPCAVQFDAQKGASLSWPDVRDSEFVWDFDDGGSRTDADGFLAAVVYEAAGTYHPTVTVDGVTWSPQTITVTSPVQIRCVSLASNWTGCPAGASHHTSVSSVLSGLSSGTHVLFHRGENYGSQNLSNHSNVSFGAYGTGNKPVLSASSTWLLSAGQSLVDIQVSGSNTTEMRGDNTLLLRVDGSASSSFSYSANTGNFFIDSNLSGSSYGMYLDAACSRLVIKNSNIDRRSSGQHTIRAEHCSRMLIQNSSITGNGGQTGLRITNTDWSLIQGNYMNRVSGFQNTIGEPNSNTNSIWERNINDAGGYINTVEIKGSTSNILVRNSVALGGANVGAGFKAEGSTSNLWMINNTVYNSAATDSFVGIECNGSGCMARNNLVYAQPRSTGPSCVSGGTQSNNWCFTTNATGWCKDPQTGGSTCYNPTFGSTSYGNQDFLRPGPGTRGIDQGYQSVPVWNDCQDADRTMIDVGALER